MRFSLRDHVTMISTTFGKPRLPLHLESLRSLQSRKLTPSISPLIWELAQHLMWESHGIFEISALMHEGYSSLSLYVFVYYWLSILYDESKKIGILLGLPYLWIWIPFVGVWLGKVIQIKFTQLSHCFLIIFLAHIHKLLGFSVFNVIYSTKLWV